MGVAQKQHKEIETLKERVNYLSAKSMANNVINSGLIENQVGDPKAIVNSFLENTLGIQYDDDQ